jgi:hypothetical protein
MAAGLKSQAGLGLIRDFRHSCDAVVKSRDVV